MFDSEYLYRLTHATENFSVRSEVCTFDFDPRRDGCLLHVAFVCCGNAVPVQSTVPGH